MHRTVLFILGLALLLVPRGSFPADKPSQHTEGDKAPIVNVGPGGKSVINYGTTDVWQPEAVPDEVMFAPHAVYQWDSDYATNCLLNGGANSDKTKAELKVTNVSRYVLHNLRFMIYLFDPTIYDTEKFLHVYDVGSDDYTEIAVTRAPDLKNESSYNLPVLDLIRQNKKMPFTAETLDFLLYHPPFGKETYLRMKQGGPLGGRKTQFFTDDKKLLRERESGQSAGYKVNGTTGFRLKIIVSYQIGNIEFRHLLVGGLFYYIQNEGEFYVPKPVVVSSFLKAASSHWRREPSGTFKFIELYQTIPNPRFEDIELHKDQIMNIFFWTKNKKDEVKGTLPITVSISMPYSLMEEAKSLFDQDQYVPALNSITRVLLLEPLFKEFDMGTVYRFRGSVYRKMNDYEKAIRDYTTSIDMSPNQPDTYSLRGEVYYLMHDTDKCCLDYKSSCRLGKCESYDWARRKGFCK